MSTTVYDLVMILYIGVEGIIKKIKDTVGDNPVYLSIDVRSPPVFLPLLN